MPETVQGIVDDLVQEAQVDATSAQILRDLNRRWSTMLNGARAYRKQLAIGNTVAGTAFYPVAAVEVYYFSVAGVPYGKARRPDIYGYSQGTLLWAGQDGGLIVADADASAVKGITLIPTPATSGQAIAGFAAVDPPELTLDAAGNTLLNAHLERDMIGPLTSGVLADRYRRETRWDLVGAAEGDFAAAVQALQLRARRRYRNHGPTQIRVQGINA